MKAITERPIAVIVVAVVVLLIIVLAIGWPRLRPSPAQPSDSTTEADLATATSTVEGEPPARAVRSGDAGPAASETESTGSEGGPAPTEGTGTAESGTSAADQETGTIVGQVSLEGRATSDGIAVLLDDILQDVTEAAGTFQVTAPAGRYSVRASYAGHVTIEAAGVDVRSGEVTSLPPASLPAGDTDLDKDVDLFDLVRCIVELRGGELPAGDHGDANGDGVTDIRDLILTRQNFGAVSPAPWSE